LRQRASSAASAPVGDEFLKEGVGMRRLLVACVLAATAAWTLPSVASAGVYVDYECAGPNGQPVAAAGFIGVESPKSSAINTCGNSGGQVNVGLTGDAPWTGGLSAVSTFKAPADTRIASVYLFRATSGAPVGSSFLTYQINVDDTLIDGCLPSAGCAGDVSGDVAKEGLNASTLELTAGCGGTISNTCATPVRLGVTRAAVTLRDDIAPVASNLRGSLFAAKAKSGNVDVAFDVTDRGGGVYRTVTTIDGKLFEAKPLALGTCTDLDPTNANPYEFAGAVPCPLSQVGLTTTIDTTKLTDGVHTIAVTVEDAAGNSTPVVAAGSRFTVRNGRANGSPAGRTAHGRLKMWFASNHKTQRASRYGTRVVVRGHLRDRRGRGIRGAEVEVFHYVAGHRRLLKTGLRSRRYGRLTLILPMNLFGDARGKRRIAFYYRATRPGPVTSRANLYLTIRNRHGGPQTQ
jgi:hypothetical protein